MDTEALIAVLALAVSVLSAAVAGSALSLSVRGARRETFLRFQEQYDSTEMYWALRRVGDWNGKGRRGSPRDEDRRMITSYVTRLVQLRDSKLIGAKDFKVLADSPGLNLARALVDVERELTHALQKGADDLGTELFAKSWHGFQRAIEVLEQTWRDELDRSCIAEACPPGVF